MESHTSHIKLCKFTTIGHMLSAVSVEDDNLEDIDLTRIRTYLDAVVLIKLNETNSLGLMWILSS